MTSWLDYFLGFGSCAACLFCLFGFALCATAKDEDAMRGRGSEPDLWPGPRERKGELVHLEDWRRHA